MATLAESYARAFSPQSFFGLDMVINWISLVILVWIIGLSYLVWKSDSSKHQNRFIGTLLFFEGLKGLWQGTSVVPYSVDFQAAWDVLWIFKIDVFFVAQITAVLLYCLFPVYFKINALKFMYREKLQKFAWAIAPILGIIIWILIKDTSAFTLENASWLSCSAVGAEPELHVWYGGITAEAQQIQSSIGACPAVFESLVSDQQVALWGLSLVGTPASILALLLIRNSLKKGDLDEENVLITDTLQRVLGQGHWKHNLLFHVPGHHPFDKWRACWIRDGVGMEVCRSIIHVQFQILHFHGEFGIADSCCCF